MFDNLKKATTSAPVLVLPIDNAPFRIHADSSGFATGAVLSQLQQGQWQPVAFLSKALSDVERNYNIHDRELLSIIRALQDWRRYLLGSDTPVKIISDHANLRYFMKSQKLNRHQARWSLELANYNFILIHFILIHKPASHLAHADALSRRADYDKGIKDNANMTILQHHLIQALNSGIIDPPFLDAIWTNQHLLVLEKAKVNSKLLGWSLQDGLITHHNRICVPDVTNLCASIIRHHHDDPSAGHPGRFRSIKLIQRNFWWPSISRDVQKYVSGCPACQLNKIIRNKPTGLLTPNEIPSDTWEIVSCDLITDLPLSNGFDSIFVVVDRHSKMIRQWHG